MTADEILAEQARPRDLLLAELAAAVPPADNVMPWRVVRQSGNEPEQYYCSHRWEWRAERCARKREADDDGLGVRYTVRRAGGESR